MEERIAGPSHRTVVTVLLASLLTTAIHYTDNYVSIEDYPQPDWVNREIVVIAWVLFTVIGLAAYQFYREGRLGWAGAYLIVYGYTGLSSLGHYFHGSLDDFTARMHVMIAADGIVGAAVTWVGVWCLVSARRHRRLPPDDRLTIV